MMNSIIHASPDGIAERMDRWASSGVIRESQTVGNKARQDKNNIRTRHKKKKKKRTRTKGQKDKEQDNNKTRQLKIRQDKTKQYRKRAIGEKTSDIDA